MPALSAATFLWAEGTSIGLGDKFNLLFNVLAAGLLFFVIVRGGKGRVKDETIKDLQDALSAKDSRNKELAEDLRNAELQKRNIESATEHCKLEAARWQAKYEELQPYTAERALESVMTLVQTNEQTHQALLEKHDAAQQLRHREIMASLETLNASVRGSR